MPCHYDDFGASDREKARALDELTRVACDMRTILRRHGLESELCAETLSWIAQHDAADAKRIAIEAQNGIRDATRQTALSKLTMEERRVLGL